MVSGAVNEENGHEGTKGLLTTTMMMLLLLRMILVERTDELSDAVSERSAEESVQESLERIDVVESAVRGEEGSDDEEKAIDDVVETENEVELGEREAMVIDDHDEGMESDDEVTLLCLLLCEWGNVIVRNDDFEEKVIEDDTFDNPLASDHDEGNDCENDECVYLCVPFRQRIFFVRRRNRLQICFR